MATILRVKSLEVEAAREATDVFKQGGLMKVGKRNVEEATQKDHRGHHLQVGRQLSTHSPSH